MSKVILVVEDSPVQRMFLQETLLEAGYPVLLAEDGQKALDILRAPENRIALVLADIEMPVIDGYQLCRTMIEDPRLREIPVVLISSLDDTEAVRKGFQCGARDFLSKRENDEEEIRARVAKNLGQSSSPAPIEPLDVPRTPAYTLPNWMNFEPLGFGVAVLDLRRSLVYANGRARDFFGLRPEEPVESLDPRSLDGWIDRAFGTLADNGRRFVHPIEAPPADAFIRLEELYDARRDICGLLILVWRAGEG